jgi:hypothetical protein
MQSARVKFDFPTTEGEDVNRGDAEHRRIVVECLPLFAVDGG